MIYKLYCTLVFSSGNRGRGSAVVVGLPQGNGAQVKNAFTTPGGNVTLITLNNEGKHMFPPLILVQLPDFLQTSYTGVMF